METDIPFKILAHEMRSPTGVIAGYARMLEEGRLDGEARTAALTQIARAAERLARIGVEAAELARWIGPNAPAKPGRLRLETLVQRAVAQSASPDIVSVSAPEDVGRLDVATSDPHALTLALTAVIDAVIVDCGVHHVGVGVLGRIANDPSACDLLVGPAPRLASDASEMLQSTKGERLSIDRGGLGLALILGVAVLDAHRAITWTTGDPQSIIGIHLVTV